MELLRWIGLLLATLHGADASAPPKATVVEIQSTATRLPTPSLKYRLLPRYIDMSPGNATPIYLRAMLVMSEMRMFEPETDATIARGLSLSPEELRADKELRQLMQQFQSSYGLFAIGARKEHADWESLVHDSQDIFTIPLPHVHSARHAVQLIALKARFELAEGEFEQGVESLSTACSLCRHLCAEPFAIAILAARSAFGVVLNTIEWGMALPNSPNLYWALTSLPQPILACDDAADVETGNIYFFFPELRPRLRKMASDATWSASLDRFLHMVKVHEGLQQDGPFKLLASMSLEQVLEDAAGFGRERLKRQGVSEAAIAAIPKAKLALLDALEQFDEIGDEGIRTASLPDWQAAPLIPAVERRLASAAKNGSRLSQAMCALTPSWATAHRGEIRMERHVAMIRCLEAIRHYAAVHGNRLPTTLNDIQEPPIPLDPTLNQPFDYSLDADGSAVLKTKDVGNAATDRVYRVRMK